MIRFSGYYSKYDPQRQVQDSAYYSRKDLQRLVQDSGYYSKYDLQRLVHYSGYYSKAARVLFRVLFSIQGIIQNTTCSVWFRINGIIQKKGQGIIQFMNRFSWYYSKYDPQRLVQDSAYYSTYDL